MVTILATVVVLGALIFVHELGHFLAAKALGVKVERFSLGFPPKMIGKKVGETEYMLSWIPLGGYVKMFGENPDESTVVPPEEEHRSFSHKPAWARFIIVFAGPFFNFLFAFLVFTIIYMASGINHFEPEVGRVIDGQPAAEAGIQPGDRITAVDGQAVKYYDDFSSLINASEGSPVKVAVDRNGQTLQFTLKPYLHKDTDLFGDPYEDWRIGIQPSLSTTLAVVTSDSPAKAAGLEAGDRITAIDGLPTKDWYDILTMVQSSQGRTLQVTVDRNGQSLTLPVTPRLVDASEVSDAEKVYRIGIQNQDEMVSERLGPFSAVYYGAIQTANQTYFIVKFVVRLIQGRFSARKTLGGPIRIAQLAGEQAQEGVLKLIVLAAVLSINLGILNLLPIPVLDGGHLFFFALEMIVRRPINLNIRERAQQVGLVFLILFMAFVFYNDLARIFGGSEGAPPQTETRQEQTAPAPSK